MSYRFYPERVEPIGSKVGVGDTDMIVPVTGYDGMRVTIPQLSIVTGATAQVLTVMQVKEIDTMAIVDPATKKVTETKATVKKAAPKKTAAAEKPKVAKPKTTKSQAAAKKAEPKPKAKED